MTHRPAFARRLRATRGQAITETVLMMWGLVLLIAIMVQAFLIDQTAFTLVTNAHAKLFNDIAYKRNSFRTGYSQQTVSMGGSDANVPMIGYFRQYGLTSDDLRIRNRGGGAKKLTIGSGTASDIATGVAGLADATVLISDMSNNLNKLKQAGQKAEKLKNALQALTKPKK